MVKRFIDVVFKKISFGNRFCLKVLLYIQISSLNSVKSPLCFQSFFRDATGKMLAFGQMFSLLPYR